MRLAILTLDKSVPTETFIQNHIIQLPFDKTVIFGKGIPFMTEKSQPSKREKRLNLILNSIRKRVGISMVSIKKSYLIKLLKSNKIDVVFAEYLNTGASVVEVCKSLKLPLVAIVLGYEVAKYHVIENNKAAYQKLFQYASKIIVVSNQMTNILVELGCPKDKIVFSPAGPEASFFKIEPKFNNQNIFAIGRFVEKKAPYLTILAFEKVLQNFPRAKLLMAGDGPLLGTCKDLVSALKIEKSVKFLGRIDQEEQKQFLKDCIIFVQHSKIASDGDSEGTPVSILEASAAGIPVVSTIHAGIPDVILHNKTGLLSEENNIDAMADHICQLLNNIDFAKELGNAGKVYIEENYSLSHHINTLQKVLETAEFKA